MLCNSALVKGIRPEDNCCRAARERVAPGQAGQKRQASISAQPSQSQGRCIISSPTSPSNEVMFLVTVPTPLHVSFLYLLCGNIKRVLSCGLGILSFCAGNARKLAFAPLRCNCGCCFRACVYQCVSAFNKASVSSRVGDGSFNSST